MHVFGFVNHSKELRAVTHQQFFSVIPKGCFCEGQKRHERLYKYKNMYFHTYLFCFLFLYLGISPVIHLLYLVLPCQVYTQPKTPHFFLRVYWWATIPLPWQKVLIPCEQIKVDWLYLKNKINIQLFRFPNCLWVGNWLRFSSSSLAAELL